MKTESLTRNNRSHFWSAYTKAAYTVVCKNFIHISFPPAPFCHPGFLRSPDNRRLYAQRIWDRIWGEKHQTRRTFWKTHVWNIKHLETKVLVRHMSWSSTLVDQIARNGRMSFNTLTLLRRCALATNFLPPFSSAKSRNSTQPCAALSAWRPVHPHPPPAPCGFSCARSWVYSRRTQLAGSTLPVLSRHVLAPLAGNTWPKPISGCAPPDTPW